MTDSPFKTCGSCRTEWTGWRSFILDPGVRLLGLQAAPGLADANALVFEHRCGSSVSVLASRLRHLVGAVNHAGDLPVLYGSERCQGHCRSLSDLSSCDRPCANARDRRLTILVSEMQRGIERNGSRGS
jgi:hypothetical protein